MSDEFDKEAEREKLRKKFAEDEEKRSDTRRMSELLLQGATMTNKHCDSCGDPLFRDDGQTFCPTCQGAEEGAADQLQGGTPASGGEPQQRQQPRQAQEAGAERRVNRRQAGNANQTPPDAQAGDGEAGSTPQLPENAEVIAQADDQPSSSVSPAQRGASQPPESGSGAGQPGDELRRAVTETARKASAATDPRTARAWLEASKEAAEALAALEQ